jgi:hypothetical protein
VLERCGGNKREACRALDISYHTLQAYLRYPSASADDGTNGAWQPEGSLDPAASPEAADSPCAPTAES